jgi:hypothetical protein
MIDTWPASLRHLFLIILPVILGWVSSDVIPPLKDRNPLVATLVGAAVVAILGWITPLTRQYGVGSSARAEHSR